MRCRGTASRFLDDDAKSYPLNNLHLVLGRRHICIRLELLIRIRSQFEYCKMPPKKGAPKRVGHAVEDNEEGHAEQSSLVKATEPARLKLDSTCDPFDHRSGLFCQPGLINHLFDDEVIARFEPIMELLIQYTDFNVDFGSDAEGWHVKQKPTVVQWRVPTGASTSIADGSPTAALDLTLAGLYTLVCFDPDSPRRGEPTQRSFLHWLVTNIPGNGSSSDGVEIMKYAAPNPSIGTHRYVFLLLRQPGSGAPDDASNAHVQVHNASSNGASQISVQPPAMRPSFDVPAFIKQYNLQPVGINFFALHPPDFGSWGGSKKKKKR